MVRLIYLSFALDSLLKIDVGIKIHVGILLTVVWNAFYFVSEGWKKRIVLRSGNVWLFMFGLYILASGLFGVGLKSLFIFVYFFLAMNVFFFIKKNFKLLDQKVFLQFQYLLIITGLLQFLMFFLFEYQINFLGTDHYSKASSVARRLRGFFVEPNWYAIAITFNTFLLIGKNLNYFIKTRPVLFFFTLLAMLLNGTFGTLAILFAVYGYKYLKRNFVVAILLLLVGLITFNEILEKRAEVKKGKSGIELFNYGSRLRPLQKVVHYLNDKGSVKWAFGEGFGSWGTLGIEERLSVLTFEPDFRSRDSSELHVFLFELGIVGTLLFFLDFMLIWIMGSKQSFHIGGALLLFLASFLLYPIFKYWMYMVYYFYFRERILQKHPRVT